MSVDYEPTGHLGRIVVERPPLPKRKSVVVRFLEKVEIRPGECWLWQGEISKNGYGGFRHGETKWAHRASYLLFVGAIPDGMTIDHLCYEKRCVNPDHLAVADPVENRRRESRGWSTCDRYHPNEPTRIAVRRRGTTYCAECHKVRQRKLREGQVEVAAPQKPHEGQEEA